MGTMKPSRFQIAPLRLGLKAPLVTAREAYAERVGFTVALEDEAGRVGRGEAMPLPAFGTESVDECEQALADAAPRLIGRALEGLDAVAPMLAESPGLEGSSAARHALECALLDLLAQERGVPLAGLLGGAPLEHVEVNALLSASEPGALAREALDAVAAGFRTLKVKVATGELSRDVERLRAVRDAVGGAAQLRIDPNGAWSEPRALAALEALAPFGLELCEQPVAPEDFEALRRLRRRGIVPIGADEAVPLPGALDALLRADAPAVDWLVLKPMVVGGLLRTLEIARRAAGVGVGAYVTSSIDGPLARVAAVHLAAVMPRAGCAHGLAVGRLFRELDPEPLVPRGGQLSVPRAPGLGL